MSTACGRPQGGGGQAHVDACGQREKKPDFFLERHKWMAPYTLRFPPFLFNFPLILQVPPIFQMFLCSYTKFSSPYQNVTFPSPKLTKPLVSL